MLSLNVAALPNGDSFVHEITCSKRDCSSAAQYLLGWFWAMGKAVFVRRGKTLIDTGIMGYKQFTCWHKGKKTRNV